MAIPAGRSRNALIDGARIADRQCVGIVAVAPASFPELRIAQVGERHIVELQIGAALIGKKSDGAPVGVRNLVPKLGKVWISLARHRVAAAAHVEHRGRGNRLLGGLRCGILEKRKRLGHDRLRAADPPGHGRHGRLLVGSAEATLIRHGGDAHTIELAQKIDVPIVAAQLAIGDRAQADRFLPLDDCTYRVVLDAPQLLGGNCPPLELRPRLDELPRSEQASDLIGAKRRLNGVVRI